MTATPPPTPAASQLDLELACRWCGLRPEDLPTHRQSAPLLLVLSTVAREIARRRARRLRKHGDPKARAAADNE